MRIVNSSCQWIGRGIAERVGEMDEPKLEFRYGEQSGCGAGSDKHHDVGLDWIYSDSCMVRLGRPATYLMT